MTQVVTAGPELGPDPFSADPFFKRRLDTQWNACIGRQGDEENYIDGYIDAAKALVETVIEKKLFGARDTLVLPILYNARHAVELVLKFAADRLAEVEALPRVKMLSHDVMAFWRHLRQVGDEKLRDELAALEPFIESMDRIDADGQALRYHLNRGGERSLDDRALANLEVIRESLDVLSQAILAFKNRTLTFLDERATGTFTARCSRRDLAAIANLLPRRELWNSSEFKWAKDKIKSRYGLSNTQFSLALNAIQRSRELNALLGVESTLLHLSDERLEWLAGQWRLMHPARDEAGTVVSGFATVKELLENDEGNGEVVESVDATLTDDELADVDAIFYIARDHIFSEFYEERVGAAKRKHAAQGDRLETLDHLLTKTNFLRCITLAAERLGRPSLARKLAAI